jgi:hypothetical protein
MGIPAIPLLVACGNSCANYAISQEPKVINFDRAENKGNTTPATLPENPIFAFQSPTINKVGWRDALTLGHAQQFQR